MPRSPRPLPVDDKLPNAQKMLDLDTASDVLGEALADRLAIRSLRFRYIDYDPGQRLVVQYEVTTATTVVDAVAAASPAGVTAFCYPEDPALPLLARPEEVAGLVGGAGHPMERLAWVPGQRAALRLGDVVVKLYASAADAKVAARRLVDAGSVLPTAQRVIADVGRGLVAQRAIPGRPLVRSDAVLYAQRAVELLSHLSAAQVPDLPGLSPADLLLQSEAPRRLVSFAVPELADRVAAIHDHLFEQIPARPRHVTAHGDFNVGQLIDTGNGLSVIDLDTLCLAPAAFDLAAYATNVVSGRAGDAAYCAAVADAVVDSVGRRPEHFDWYLAATLLRRVDRAVRRLKRDWPERTEEIVSTLEAVLGN